MSWKHLWNLQLSYDCTESVCAHPTQQPGHRNLIGIGTIDSSNSCYIYLNSNIYNCPCTVDLFSKYLEIRIRTRQNDHLFLLCSKRIISHFTLSAHMLMLLMEEILHHLGCIKPCKSWDKLHINWCRISSINSMHHVYPWKARGQVASSPFEFRPVQRNCQGGANLAPASKTDLFAKLLGKLKKKKL